ncbi:MAG: hypothetical protein AB3N17_15160 [Tateyamaria sp.]
MADPVCMEATEMEAALIDWYGETPVGGAWSDDQQLWASEASGTWTLMHLLPDGRACVLSQGNNWQSNEDPVIALERSLNRQGERASASAVVFLKELRSGAS